MKTITVLTPANIEIEYRLAGAGSRLAAFVIDILLQAVACLVIAVIVLFGLAGYRFDTILTARGLPLAVVLVASYAIFFGYFIVCEMLMTGQSIGKRLFGLRVIRDNGRPIGFTQSMIRNLFRVTLDILYVGLFAILIHKKHKRVGDMAAGTVVVSEHYNTALDASLTLPTENTALMIAASYDHLVLSEAERDMLLAYLRRKADWPDGGTALRTKIAAYLAAKWDASPDMFTDAVLRKLVG